MAVSIVVLVGHGTSVFISSSLSLFPSCPGAPDNATLHNLRVGAEEDGNEYKVTLSANFTDYSEVPVTKIRYVITQSGVSKNITVQVSEMNGGVGGEGGI